MRPYYEEKGITIYNADCRDVLPRLPQVDLALTDPPYGINKDGQRPSTGTHGGRKAYEFGGWDSERPQKEAFDLLRAASRHQIIWGGNYFADLLPATAGWLVWDSASQQEEQQEEAERIIASIKSCVDRGEGKGICHVFIDHSNICQCGKIDLTRERMK